MGKFAHYLAHNKGVELPSSCIWFDTETNWETRADGYDYHSLWFGWACYSRRRTNDTWTAPEWFMFSSIAEFWEFVLDKTRHKTRLYLFSHNGAFDLPVVNAFSELPARGYHLKFACVDAPPMIVDWRADKSTIKYIDTLNIWRFPLAELGAQLGIPKLTMPKERRLSKAWKEYGRIDVEIIYRACMAWFRFIREKDLGGFAPTLASQSFNAFRHRFMTVPIFVHANSKALALERAAYLGGRTECFYIGKRRGRFYQLDVNSMYPAVMRDNKFPVKLISVYTRATLSDIKEWILHDCLIADVLVETDAPIYPIVQENRLIFPVGKIRATLSTPELVYALEHSKIIKLYSVAVYESAKPFSAFVDEIYSERLKAALDGRSADKFNLKILLNSLYGKFGQTGRRYEIIDDAPPDEIEVIDEVNVDDGTITRRRKFGGVVQEEINDGESLNSVPSIAAHVTAYARMLLWQLIEIAGVENILYCDTDSLLVCADGYDKLRSRISPDRLGALKLEAVYKDIDIRGPKDYCFGEREKIKGIRHNATKLSSNSFEQVYFVGMRGLLRLCNLSAPMTKNITKTLSREYRKGTVQKNGRVLPLRLSML